MKHAIRVPLFLLAALVAVFGLSMLTSASSAASAPKKLEVGNKAPAWKDLVGIDDKKHSLSDLAKAKLVVVVFTCNHCPVARAYEDRLVAFARDCKKKGVAVVAINVNNLPADRLDKMKVRAKEKKFAFPYLYDPSQKIGRAYGARVTPHWYVLDKDRKVAYIGAFDNNSNPSRVTRKYVPDAVKALLAGKKPEITHTRAVGCGIKYENKK